MIGLGQKVVGTCFERCDAVLVVLVDGPALAADVLARVRAHLGAHFAAVGVTAEPTSASVTFLGLERMDVLRFGSAPGGGYDYVSLGCSRYPMADPTAVAADPQNGALDGGGAVLRPSNRNALHSRCHVFYLRSSPEELFRRLRHDTQRPLLQVDDPLHRLRDLFRERDPLYRRTAHFVVEAAGAVALARGMQGLTIRLARRLNVLLGRRGKLFAQRYHARPLRTPTEVRNAIRYVLLNGRHEVVGFYMPQASGVLPAAAEHALFAIGAAERRWHASG